MTIEIGFNLNRDSKSAVTEKEVKGQQPNSKSTLETLFVFAPEALQRFNSMSCCNLQRLTSRE